MISSIPTTMKNIDIAPMSVGSIFIKFLVYINEGTKKDKSNEKIKDYFFTNSENRIQNSDDIVFILISDF